LKGNLDHVAGLVGSIEEGIARFRNVLRDVDRVLGYPASINASLGKVADILEALYDVAEAVSVLPEVGPPAGQVARALEVVVVKPKPPGGVIGEIRRTLTEMDEPLKKLRDELDKIKRPVDDAWSALDSIRLKIAGLQVGVDTLIREHGEHAPAGVDACASRLNAVIEAGIDALNAAERNVRSRLSAIIEAVSEIEDQLNNLDAFSTMVENILAHVTSGAFHQLKTALDKLRADVDKLKHLGEKIFEAVMRAMGIDIGSVQRGLAKVEARVEGFVGDALKKAARQAEQALVAQIERIPGARELEAQVASLQRAAADLRDSIEDKLGRECAEALSAL
jgi:chromosome segregation ATPase